MSKSKRGKNISSYAGKRKIFVVNEIDGNPVVQSFDVVSVENVGYTTLDGKYINFWNKETNIIKNGDPIFTDPTLALTHYITMKTMEYANHQIDAEDAIKMALEANKILAEDYK